MNLKPELNSLYKIGAAAAFLQLAAVVATIVIVAILGPKPASVADYFVVFQNDRLAGILRDDFFSLVMVTLYLGIVPALFAALRQVNFSVMTLASLFILAGVNANFATHSSFSMLYLSERYAAAATTVEQDQLFAAGEAVLASNIWNSSGAYMAGILLQGAGVMISLVMLRSRDFSKLTACAGLLANGIDLTQHLLHPFAPAIAAPLIMVMGPFYLAWFPLLARDLFQLGCRLKPLQVSAGQAA